MSLGIFIPSYNRPMQLLALLESIRKYNDCIFDNIHVRYLGIGGLQIKGYSKVLENPICDGIDIRQKSGLSLSQDMYGVMKNSKYDFFGFITDDSIFYRPFCVTLDDLFDFMREDTNHFSFRLGLNTQVVDYTNHSLKEELTDYKKLGPFLKFPWIYHRNHYGFPCALDGTVYDRKYILKMTEAACGDNFDYRYMECRLHEHLKIHSNRHYGLCLPQSVLINIPANMVSDGPYCKNGVQYSYTVDELTKKLIDGYKIDISKIDTDSIVSVQQEIPFQFCKNDN